MAENTNKQTVNMASENVPTTTQLQEKIFELVEKCRQQAVQLQQATYIISNKQLDYLFKVLEFKDLFDQDFIKYCVSEITDTIWQKPTDQDK